MLQAAFKPPAPVNGEPTSFTYLLTCLSHTCGNPYALRWSGERVVADDALPVVGFEANEDTGSRAFALAWNPCRASLAQIRRLPVGPYLKADARLNIQSTPAGGDGVVTYPTYLPLSYPVLSHHSHEQTPSPLPWSFSHLSKYVEQRHIENVFATAALYPIVFEE